MDAVNSYLDVLRESYDTRILVAFAAFAIGIAFGAIAEASQFCLRAAVSEWNSEKPTTGSLRTVQYLSAILASVIGVQFLQFSGVIDLTESLYWSAPIRPVALVVGGVAFGIGMVLAGGCISRILVLGFSGNIRSLFTIIIAAIAAYATLRGILSYPRILLEHMMASQGGAGVLIADNAHLWAFAAAIALIGALVVLVRKSGSIKGIASGLGVGALVIFGWLATGIVGADEFEPTALTSLSMVSPLAESLQFSMIYTGDEVRFPIALIGGILLGALVSSVIGGRFKLSGFTSEAAPLRYGLGGLMMGFGGVTALGCSVGQGVSGIGTLSLSSFIAFAAIIGGAVIAMRVLNRKPLMQAPPMATQAAE
ncbi:MAG: YeeE/YedE family protein [Rhizobiaceae bacterium]